MKAAEELIARPQEKPTAEEGRMLELLSILLSGQYSMVDGQAPGGRVRRLTNDR
jgi:hypothetical protein